MKKVSLVEGYTAEYLKCIICAQVPVPFVSEDERLLVKPLEYPGFFRVIARYGYRDLIDQGNSPRTSVLDKDRDM